MFPELGIFSRNFLGTMLSAQDYNVRMYMVPWTVSCKQLDLNEVNLLHAKTYMYIVYKNVWNFLLII